jgi:hypothetical protein
VKQAQAVDIAYILGGEVVSTRRLSKRGEWRAAALAFGSTAGLGAGAALIVAGALAAAHRVVFGPAFLMVWVVLGLGGAALAAWRAAARARAYRIGAAIDDDAFSSVPLALVHRGRHGYQMRIAPGFSGRLRGGRAPIPVESLVDKASVDVPLAMDGHAELRLGPATFVLSSAPEAGPAPELPKGVLRRLVRRALMPLELAALVSLFCAVPAGRQIGEAEMRSAIPADATPWEVEKLLRAEAQTQARALHQCFDVMPISCQRPGYVGVGVSLSREGEIRSRWIARSTYGSDCPVNECLSDVVSTWFFEPLPEPIKVILPVQVLRTDKPLPWGHARAAADAARNAAVAERTTSDVESPSRTH